MSPGNETWRHDMPGSPSIQVLILQNRATSEPMSLMPFLRAQAPRARLDCVNTVDEAALRVESKQRIADLLIVIQQWPDEYTSADVSRLLALMPLSRLVCCYGPWCESDGRNRDIWPLAARVPQRDAEARIRLELSVLRGQLAPLPLTAGRDEIFAFSVSGNAPPSATSPTPTAVVSPDSSYRWSLINALGESHRALEPTGASVPPQAVLWDADPWNGTTAERLAAFCDENPTAAVVALTSDSHYNEAALRFCGADVVTPKTRAFTEMAEQLQLAVTRRLERLGLQERPVASRSPMRQASR